MVELIYGVPGRKKTIVVEASVETLTKMMFKFLRDMRAKGHKLSDVEFCWRPLRKHTYHVLRNLSKEF